MNLGLFIQIADPKMWLVVKGVMTAARQNRSQVTVYGCPDEQLYSRLDESKICKLYGNSWKHHDAVIYAFAGDAMQAVAEEAWSRGKPSMLIARHRGKVPSTMNDFKESMVRAVKTMSERGHTRIAFLSGPAENNQSASEKMQGYLQGLKECGLEEEESLIIHGDYTEENGREVTTKALAVGLDCTAFLASNDLGAIGAMHAFREAGISPGADVEVLGYDNIPRAKWTKPALSSHEPHYYQLGHVACEQILRCIRGEPYALRSEIRTTLIPRSTTWDSATSEVGNDYRTVEWMENRFLYEAQLAILRREQDATLLIWKLKEARGSPASFTEAFRELLGETTRQGLSAGCLSPLLAFEAGNEKEEQMLGQCRSLQTSVLFEEQKRRTESALRYNTASAKLRTHGLDTSREDAVVRALEDTLSSLHIHKARLFLNDTPGPLEETRGGGGEWLWMDGGSGRFSRRRVPEAGHGPPEDTCEADAWIHMPLLQDRELLGFAVLDAASEFLPHYPDLVRQFSTALHAGRMQCALAKANAELVETSRLAGLAEMATGVLHNIGNALNSVNTSCALLTDRVAKSHMSGVSRVARLLAEHREDAGDFITKDAKGRQIPDYLAQLGSHLEAEQAAMADELAELRSMVDHINQIVAAQQSYAQVSGVVESVPPEELIEFALRLGEASLSRHGITVRRDYRDTGPVRVQRQKAVQILVNLIRNAKESMDEARPPEKFLDLSIREGRPGHVLLRIADNGQGIHASDMARMFSFGYTTKPHGHGFGLHNSALAAREMGGFLNAASEGPGKGAQFDLELPLGSAG